jgi:hypothetical protein
MFLGACAGRFIFVRLLTHMEPIESFSRKFDIAFLKLTPIALEMQVRVSVVLIRQIQEYITPVAALVLLSLHVALLVHPPCIQ